MQANSYHSNRSNLRLGGHRSQKRPHNLFQLRSESHHAALSQQRRFAPDSEQSSPGLRRFFLIPSLSIRIVSVRRSALALYYRVLDSSPHLLHLFFSVSLSMFENTSNTDLLITKNVQKHVFDAIIAWRTSHSSLSGWICLEFLNPGSISVFEVLILLLFSRADDYETPSRPKLPPFGQSDALVYRSDRVVSEQPDPRARVDFDAREGSSLGRKRVDASESSLESSQRGLALICSTISE